MISQRMMSLRMVLAAGAVAATSFLETALAHDFWINRGHFRSSTGEHCCGPNDCSMIQAEQVSVTSQGYRLSTGEVVPFTEAQGSEDGEYWRCERRDGSRRCFFAPQPSS